MLDKKSIPAKSLVENNISQYITEFYNESKSEGNFPSSLKLADITPTPKKKKGTAKNNYRPVSTFSSISKRFEKNMFKEFSAQIDKYLSPYLCRFRKGYSTQHCLTAMLERWERAMDKGKFAEALLTNLSKAFDCINAELLIAKLEAYGFDLESLTYICSYLTEKKQRTKRSFSKWADITFGVPQGSMLGYLLFNIHFNNIFYFIPEDDVANFADDNTPHIIETIIDALLGGLWKNNIYFKMPSPYL